MGKWLESILIIFACLAMVLGSSLDEYRQQLLDHKAHLEQVMERIETVETELQEYEAPYLEAEANAQLIRQQQEKIVHDREVLRMVRWQFGQ
ncbi:MAG: hypothetical protein IJI05_01815 [Erysipelotrichaceae bacterium]|nr:hypothetical protein [Erysipelotrichaceae bacterium]